MERDAFFLLQRLQSGAGLLGQRPPGEAGEPDKGTRMARTAPHTPLPLDWFGGGAGWGCLGSSGNNPSPTNSQVRKDAGLAVVALYFQTALPDSKGNPQMASPAASPQSDLLTGE